VGDGVSAREQAYFGVLIAAGAWALLSAIAVAVCVRLQSEGFSR
jgi:hypothetical protein